MNPTLQFGEAVDILKTTKDSTNDEAVLQSSNDSFLYYIFGGIIAILCACIVLFSVLYCVHVIKQAKANKDLDQMRENQVVSINELNKAKSINSGSGSPVSISVGSAAMYIEYTTPSFVPMTPMAINDVASLSNHGSLTPGNGGNFDLNIDACSGQNEGALDDDDGDELYIMDGQVSPTLGGNMEYDAGDTDEDDGEKNDVHIDIDKDEEKEDVLQHAVTDNDKV